MSPGDPLLALRDVNALHIIIALSLFLLNAALTYIIGHEGLYARLNYLGHEMVYLGAAIVASHVFIATSNRLIPLVAVFPYLVLWVVTLALTKRIIEVGRERLHPLTGATLTFGLLAIYFSLTGVVEQAVANLAPHSGV